jgi:hypothetical protein
MFLETWRTCPSESFFLVGKFYVFFGRIFLLFSQNIFGSEYLLSELKAARMVIIEEEKRQNEEPEEEDFTSAVSELLNKIAFHLKEPPVHPEGAVKFIQMVNEKVVLNFSFKKKKNAKKERKKTKRSNSKSTGEIAFADFACKLLETHF